MTVPSARARLDVRAGPLDPGSVEAVLDVAAALERNGLWVPAIRPPTVPQGTARLRVSLSAAHDATDVAALLSALREVP